MAVAMPIIAGLGLVAGMAQQNAQAGEAKTAARHAERERKRLEKEAKDQAAREDAINARDAARQRQEKEMMGAQGFNSTMRTGPMGLPPVMAPARKTLLGS